MGYRFPGRRLTARDCPDPDLFRQQIAPVTEELAGRLNEHNVVADTFPEERAAPNYLYDFHTVSVDADSHADTNAPNYIPDALDADSWQVPDDGDWHQVGSMILNYSASEHMVWAVGWLYYGLNGTLTQWQIDAWDIANMPRVQFAIRVNGALLEESITGTERPDDGAPRTLRPVDPIDPTPAFRTLDYACIRGTGALSWQCRPVRVQAQFLAPQGTTTVELVARRVIADMPNIITSMPPVYVYNRRLWVAELKLGETGAASGQAVAVNYPDNGEAFDKAHTYDSQIAPTIAAQNALGTDAIRRYGLRKEQFPKSGIATVGASNRVGADFTANNYPGFANTGAVGVSPNWVVVTDGLGGLTEVALNDGSGAWDFTAHPGFMVVFGNLAFVAAEGNGNRPDRYGAIGIGFLYQSGATTLGDGLSYVDQAFCNNPNIDLFGGAPYSQACLTDVPVFGAYDFRTVPPADGPVDKVRLLVSGFNTVQVDWENSNLNVIIFAG